MTLTIGATHHLLYPEVWTDPEAHRRTLAEMVDWPELAALDLFGPPGLDPRACAEEAACLAAAGKRVVYCLPLLHREPGADPSSPDPARRGAALDLARRHLDQARRCGAWLVTAVSGADPGAADRPAALEAFTAFLVDLAREAAPRLVAVEPMDRTIDKRALVGPTAEAARLIDAARAAGAANLGLICDMAHLPLLGETFDEALDATGERLRHVHLGNCVLDHPADPLYGDQHPPLGYPGGEHGPAELTAMVDALRRRGYLARPGATLSFEIRPAAGQTPRATLQQHLAWLRVALEETCAS